jgi:glycosyltransferase involved in cell wall biosynthesis
MVEQIGIERFRDKTFTNGARFVDAEMFSPSVPFEDREQVVGFLGRLDEEKGIRELAEVAHRLPADVTFVFAGDGDLADWLATELEDEISAGDIELTGWVNHDDVPGVLNRLRLLVMPSQPTEGLPTVILESLACGTPVLATPVAGVPDVLIDGGTGLHMMGRDPSYITERIVTSLTSGDLGQMSGEARKTIESSYTKGAAVSRYREFLERFGTFTSSG